MLRLSPTNETLTTYNPDGARTLLGMCDTEVTMDDAELPSGNGSITFKLFSREVMKDTLEIQCFLRDVDGRSWIPISDVYWGQGCHTRLLANVDDVHVMRVEHC